MCVAVLDYAAGRHMGFSKSISIGNKADINEVDLLRYLKDDPDTRVIIMYLEDITDGHAFIEVQGKSRWWPASPFWPSKPAVRRRGPSRRLPHRLHGRIGCRL